MEGNCEINEFENPWKGSDLVLVVQGKYIHVHRIILSLHSPVFDRMFNSNFKEKNATEIKLPEKKYEEIKEMLKVIYDRNKEITGNIKYYTHTHTRTRAHMHAYVIYMGLWCSG